jgi:hypothetical protein
MGQLQLFSRAELSGMRDKTRARNYSASRDEFRRDHERRRARGLQRRHAERLRHVREQQAGCWPEDLQIAPAGVQAVATRRPPLSPRAGIPPRPRVGPPIGPASPPPHPPARPTAPAGQANTRPGLPDPTDLTVAARIRTAPSRRSRWGTARRRPSRSTRSAGRRPRPSRSAGPRPAEPALPPWPRLNFPTLHNPLP